MHILYFAKFNCNFAIIMQIFKYICFCCSLYKLIYLKLNYEDTENKFPVFGNYFVQLFCGYSFGGYTSEISVIRKLYKNKKQKNKNKTNQHTKQTKKTKKKTKQKLFLMSL